MAGESSGGRRAVFYWIGWAVLVISIITIAVLVFQDPAALGI